jgi:hypothetical protein
MLTATADAAASVQIPAIYMPVPETNAAQLIERIWANYTAALSDNKPESSIRSPIFLAAHWLATPSRVYAEETLNWDIAIEVAPWRPSGTLHVKFEYGGPGTPTPVDDDPWE